MVLTTLRARGAIAVVVLVVFAAAATTATAKPPPLEPVRLERLPVPEGYTAIREPAWMPDGEHIVARATIEGEDGTDLAVMDRSGGNARCLTCGLDNVQGPDRPFNEGQPLTTNKPFVFPD